MTAFTAFPHLPRQALHILLGEPWREELDLPLRRLGLVPVYIPENPEVEARLRGHADLSVFPVGGARLILARYLQGTEFVRELLAMGCELSFARRGQGSAYPEDVPLNVCRWQHRWIGRPDTAAPEIRAAFEESGDRDWISVRQGYARCACCLVSEQALITADEGIARALSGSGADVLRISPGGVALPGFPYGFLGGCAFKIASGRLAFTGHLDEHPDRDAILSFLERRQIEALFLTERPAFDIGGAIPLTERED